MVNDSYPKGTKKIAKRILKAAEKGERIIIFGDTDLDGIASVVILKELFELLNPLYVQKKNISVYFPDREKEGYGISKAALDFFADQIPALFFSVDCGITNFKEVEIAKKMGYEVIIIDHHQLLGKLPKADLIVDPKQKNETYPFQDFAAAGLVYRVAQATLSQTDLPKSVQEKLVELAALATLSDQMPLKEDNREIVDQGMSSLLTTQREGLLALIELGDADIQIDFHVFQKIIAPLNSSQLRDHVAESFFLLTETSPKKTKALAQKLIKHHKQKREMISITVEELCKKIDKRKDDSILIFEASEYWPVPALGVIASKLLQVYKKPIFLFKQGETESVGSARLPKPVDGVAAMASCKKLLEVYGGHAPACGCRLKNKNLDKFKKGLEKYFSKNLCKK
ncbi:MAG: DHH family phosphoesterase [Patescibacteria group bacterium]|nr:DHH family phosphoesterase [Patescibacteria group bacterium]